MSLLEACFAAIFHELCIRASEYDNAEAPFGVAQTTASQQYVIVVQRYRLSILPFQSALELI